MSSRRLDFTAEAQRDIRVTLRYTLHVWGERQRREYAERLDTAFRELLRYPESGRAREDLSTGLRSHPVGQHVIYYRVSDQDMTIIRVMHRRMNPRSQFI